MSPRFRLFKRRNGRFYSQDNLTGQQMSLRTKDRQEALLLLTAKNRAFAGSMLNRHIAQSTCKRAILNSFITHGTMSSNISSKTAVIRRSGKAFSRANPFQSFAIFYFLKLSRSIFGASSSIRRQPPQLIVGLSSFAIMPGI